MTTATILDRAADLIEKKGWTRGALARDANDVVAGCKDRRAQKFCVLGAIYRLEPDSWGRVAAVNAVVAVVGRDVSTWNDRQKSKRPVIAALRKAAKLAAKK